LCRSMYSCFELAFGANMKALDDIVSLQMFCLSRITWLGCWYMKCTYWWIIICMLMLNYYMMYMSIEYYMKVYICVDDYYMNNLLLNYYMNVYVEFNLMNIYEIIILKLCVVVDVVRCCWCYTLLLIKLLTIHTALLLGVICSSVDL